MSTPGKFAFGLVANPSDSDIAEYGLYCLTLYKEKGWKYETLSEYNDFESFDVAMLDKIPKFVRTDLRDHLRANGVYAPKQRGLKISDALIATIRQNPSWPEDDLNALQNAERLAAPAEPSFRSNGTSSDYSFAVTNIVKAYSNSNNKYYGSFDDNRDRKLKLFEERCKQSSVERAEKPRAFSCMLKGAALDYYLDVIQPTATSYADIVLALRKRFKTKEKKLALTREWEKTKLTDCFSENSDKTPAQALSLMMARLQEIQGSLPHYFRTDEIFMNKLLNACDGVEACRLARQKPASTVEGIIADLHTSISTYIPPTTGTPTASIVYRRLRNANNRKCYECGSPKCWSTKHSREERTVRKPYRYSSNPSEETSLSVAEIGTRIEVSCPKDKTFYAGQVAKYDPEMNKYRIKYDDGDIEELDLRKENWRPIAIPASGVNIATVLTAFTEKYSGSSNEAINQAPVNFFASRKKEIDGFFARGEFLPVARTDAQGHRIFGCRFVDTVKNEQLPTRMKSQGLSYKATTTKPTGC